MCETWADAFTRRLQDGTAWTTGWTEEEVASSAAKWSPTNTEVKQMTEEQQLADEAWAEAKQYHHDYHSRQRPITDCAQHDCKSAVSKRMKELGKTRDDIWAIWETRRDLGIKGP